MSYPANSAAPGGLSICFVLLADFGVLSPILQVWLNAIRLNVSPIAAIVKVSGDASSGGGEN